MSNCEQKVEELENKLKGREEMLQKILDDEKFVARVVSGPEESKGNKYYRIMAGNAEKVVTHAPLSIFTAEPEISLDCEVLVSGSSIVAVIPQNLEIRAEKISLTKLVAWDEIGGMKSQIQTIRTAVEGPMKNRELALEMGVEPIKGILLYGPPGCGKTLVGKAIARTILNQEEVEPEAFVYMKGAEVLAPLVGVAEQTIRTTFSQSRKYSQKTGKRAVIFIDEAEAILAKRGSKYSSDVDTTIVPSFLAEMDGFDDHSPMILLATNRPENLDEAVIREGRIDLKILVARPDRKDVVEMFEIHTKKVKLADDRRQLALLGAQLMFGEETVSRVSGAMVNTMVKLAAGNALNRVINDKSCKVGITVSDLEESYQSVKAHI